MNGYRITERKEPTPVLVGRKQELSPINIKMIELIPFYPQAIAVRTLSKMLGIRRMAVEAHLSTIEGHALICQDENGLSRL